jgi:hypothetical protein
LRNIIGKSSDIWSLSLVLGQLASRMHFNAESLFNIDPIAADARANKLGESVDDGNIPDLFTAAELAAHDQESGSPESEATMNRCRVALQARVNALSGQQRQVYRGIKSFFSEETWNSGMEAFFLCTLFELDPLKRPTADTIANVCLFACWIDSNSHFMEELTITAPVSAAFFVPSWRHFAIAITPLSHCSKSCFHPQRALFFRIPGLYCPRHGLQRRSRNARHCAVIPSLVRDIAVRKPMP